MSRIVVSSLLPQMSATSKVFTVGMPQMPNTQSEYSARLCWMQRSSTTSTPMSGFRSSSKTISRSSSTLVGTCRDSSSSRSSFSSTRTRDRSTPTVGLLTPVFFGLRRERERERLRLRDFELGAAIRARHDLALHGISTDGHLGVALGTLGHGSLPPDRQEQLKR